jgi:hypothetical protein
MKKIALMMIFSVTSVVLSAEEYTIQTISALKERSITPAFEKKVQKSALSSAKKKEGDCNIVTVGSYSTLKAAQADIKKAKAISKDAFVRSLNRVTPKVCESKSNASLSSKKEEITVTVKESVVTNPTSAVAPTSVVMIQNETKAAPCKAEPCKTSPSLYLYDRNLVRKSDIHDAIEYYKNSEYHSFRPVALQR